VLLYQPIKTPDNRYADRLFGKIVFLDPYLIPRIFFKRTESRELEEDPGIVLKRINQSTGE